MGPISYDMSLILFIFKMKKKNAYHSACHVLSAQRLVFLFIITTIILAMLHAGGILVPHQALSPHPLQWEWEVLTTGPPGKPPVSNFVSSENIFLRGYVFS